MTIWNSIYKKVDLYSAMKLPVVNSHSVNEGNRGFYTTKLSIEEIIINISQSLENIYVGDDREFDLPPDEEHVDDLTKRVPADADYKVKRLQKWDDDAYQIKKNAKSQAEEEKINAIRKWIAEKIRELKGSEPTVQVIALYYAYLHETKEFPSFQVITKRKNIKEAFAIFAQDNLKLGKNSLYLKYRKCENYKLRLTNITIEELEAVMKMFAANKFHKALKLAEQEFRMLELRKK